MLAFNIDAWHQDWFHAKFGMVILLTGYQGWLAAYGKKLARGERPLSSTVRMINEVPGVAAAIIVVLVIVRPF